MDRFQGTVKHRKIPWFPLQMVPTKNKRPLTSHHHRIIIVNSEARSARPRRVSIRHLQMCHQGFPIRCSELGPGQEGPEIPPARGRKDRDPVVNQFFFLGGDGKRLKVKQNMVDIIYPSFISSQSCSGY